MTGYRKTHCISLTPEQENKLQKVKKATGYSIVKILMAMVGALDQPPGNIVEEEI